MALTITKPLHIPKGYGKLPSGWTWTRLDEISEGVFDCPHSTPKLTANGPLVVRTQDIITGVFRADQAAHVSESTYAERIARVAPLYGDLFYSREGTYFGIAAEVPENNRVCLGQRMVLIRPNSRHVNFQYLRLWLNCPVMASHVHGFKEGSVAQRLNLPSIRGLSILLPPLPEQKRIAHILCRLDDKIDLNRRMNATLEAMAQAIYKSWFVDFDPVKRNAAGGAQRPEDSLFPDSFEDSAAGDIPLGWTVERVGDVVDCVGGGTPSTKEPKFWDDGVHHWTTPKDFSSLQSPILIDTSRKLTNAGIAKISSGLLPEGTLLLSSRAPVGYLAISAIPVAINQGFIAMKCNDRASNYFMLNWCKANMGEIKSRATGTTFPEISKNSFRPISVILPPKELVAEFTDRVAPLYAQITANLHQSCTLSKIREVLLPKILSGKIIF